MNIPVNWESLVVEGLWFVVSIDTRGLIDNRRLLAFWQWKIDRSPQIRGRTERPGGLVVSVVM